jgi:hypothetical protein
LLFVLAPTAGAALFAGIHPARDDAYTGSTTVLVVPPPSSAGESLALRTERLATVMRSPGALLAARRIVGSRAGESFALGDVVVDARPAQGIVEVSVKAPTPVEARNAANALVSQSIAFVNASDLRPIREGVGIIGDFELDFEGWEVSGTGVSAVMFERGAPARYNRAALRIDCQPSDVCGAARPLSRRFRAGGSYAVSFWLRSSHSGTPIAYLLGSAADHERGDTSIGRMWTRRVVRWTPARTITSATLIIQTRATEPLSFDIDGVTLFDGPSAAGSDRFPLPVRQEEQLFRDQLTASAAPAETLRADVNDTGRWALAGAVAGLAAGAAALAAAASATRRKQLS